MKRMLALLLAALLIVSCTACGLDAAPSAQGQTAAADGGTLTVFFLDVGQADSALLVCDGAAMLIDGGNVEDGSYVVSALGKYGVETLECVVATHCDEDHCGGLAGVLAKYPAERVLCPVTEYDTKAFSNFQKYTQEQGRSIEQPEAGEQWMLGRAQVTVLGPLRDYEDNNENSIVLRVEYGETSFLFTGDIGLEAEDELVESGADVSCTVLKVAHHGSSGSSGYVFLRAAQPQYGVISVGTDNAYGHPTEQALSRLRDAEVVLYRTDLQGTITAVSDGKTVQFTTERAAAADAVDPTADSAPGGYIGNINSKIVHRDTCGSLPAEQNRVAFDSLEEAEAAGYRAHSACLP